MIDLGSNNMWLHYERPQGQAPGGATEVIKSPQVAFYQRAETLDVRMSASDHIQLDRDNMIDLDLNSGWNELTGVEIRVVPVTGGLRLRTSDAKCVDAAVDFAKAPESGILTFPSIPRDTIVKVRFPYSVEMDLTSVAIRVEVTYTTEHGTYSFAKRPHIPVALALGVNVQDVFKHQALFSRFTVSTGSQSPLRLYKSELLSSDVFESSFGVPPADPVVIFPRQPAGLLYKISRKPGVDIESASQKTMYLRLHYSVLHEEIEAKLSDSLTKSLEDTSLWQYSRLIISTIASRFLFDLSAVDQERAALVGFVPTSSIAGVQWDRVFGSTTPNVASEIASFLAQWQTSNPRLHLPTGHRPAEQQKTILIPVDIPSITIVHTADIRLQSPSDSSQLPAPDESLSPIGNGNPEFYTTSQMLPAILHLRWTRIWDTATAPSRQADLEFSYEVASSQDTWLLGGRRRGHFVIPAPTTPADGGNPSAVDGLSTTVGSSSTPLTEAEIPLLLIPQREGWLPYPSVDIREVVNNPSNQDVAGAGPAGLGIAADGSTGSHAFETDFRNTGESVRIVPDRQQVTLSLDASGPGGGPLVLGIEPGVRGVAARA